MISTQTEASGFSSLGLSNSLLTLLDRLQFKTPTPIQHQSIPVGIAGKDVIGIAQTGTGKTLAFGLPMVERLQMAPGRGLILLPTRELALQVEETLRKIGASFNIGTAVLIGGEAMGRQLEALRRKPRILIATPGRLLDHLEQRTVRLDDVRILVLDEADRMLDMGFAPQINRILKSAPKERQTLLYSATMPQTIVQIAASHMKLPVRVEVAPAGTAAEKVEQEIILVTKEAKLTLLQSVLKEEPGTTLVFSRTKHGARKICRALNQMGHKAAEIHANRSLNQRKEALDGFKKGRYQVLVATDIAARGIDVTNIGLVVNFDLPDNSDDYVHRIGRTGRAGRTGKAISFATPDQKSDIRDIERLIRQTLKVTPHESSHNFVPSTSEAPRRNRPAGRPENRGSRGNFRGSRSSGDNRGGRSSFSSDRGSRNRPDRSAFY